MSQAAPRRISPAAWGFLLLAGAALLLAIILATVDLARLDGQTLNPLSLRVLPRQFQVNDLWREALPQVLLAGGVALSTLWLPRRPWSYGLIQLLLMVAALRYLIWRGTTINTAHPFSLFCSLILYGAELLYLITTSLQLLPSLRYDPGLRSRQADQLQHWLDEKSPEVDIWIPTYNEPERIVRRAILACRNLSYNHRTITVLDDGHRPSIAALAAELGVQYLSREGNAHRKAGNLNHALEKTSGEFIAVFDCDFIPYAPFLERTLAFFADPEVALVQTPQHYFQAEFHNRNLGLDVVMPSDLDYFFRYLQVIRDRSNAVICCGTSYVVRRKALESIGGYVTSCLIEDHQTSTKLLTRGWQVRYLDEVLSMGEVPRTFADFLDQRLRWMQGNIQIFFRPKELPIWASLSFRQLAFYLNLAFSLGTPICRLIYIALPLLSLTLGFSLIAAPPIEYLAYGVPFILLLYTLPSWLSDHHQFQFWNEVYETVFCLPGLRRLIQVLRHPFRIYGGIVTSKDASAKQQSFNLRLSWPLLFMLGLLLVTVVVRYLLPLLIPGAGSGTLGFQGETLMLIWALSNGCVLAVALMACIDQPVRRAVDRFPIQRIGCIQVQDQKLWGTTQDISEQGAEFLLQSHQPALGLGPVALELTDPNIKLEADIVRRQGNRLALHFKRQHRPVESALLGLLYSGEHWFHRPRRLSTSDALLHWFGTLWKADPILRRFG
ncbi:MAG: glycosyltransferase family 2 protein [Vulcanococcus sp.]